MTNTILQPIDLPQQTPHIYKHPEQPNQIANKIAKYMKNFSLGALVGAIGTPILIFSLCLVEIIVLKRFNFISLNSDEKIESICSSFQEFITEFSSEYQLPPSFLKGMMLIGGAGLYPIYQEIFYRGIIQDLLLTRTYEYIEKKISFDDKAPLNSKVIKAIRILCTTTLFFAIELPNFGLGRNTYSFLNNIGLGILKESTVGISGSIGAHIAKNSFMISPIFLLC